jgi:hypothetical protein
MGCSRTEADQRKTVHAGLVAHGGDRALQVRGDDLDAGPRTGELAQLLQLGG